MGGTDASRAEAARPGPIMVLVEPQMGENIGAAARGMWNFGLRSMRVVAPRDGWPNPAAVAMASGAGGLLGEAQLFGTTADAVADCHWILATTARPREMAKTVLTPERAMTETAGRIQQGQRVAVLFGRERTGLENADVVRADAIVTVPVNPAFASLNLAQCVLLTAYEWRRATDRTPGEQFITGRTEPATADEVDRMLNHLTGELDRAEFFHPPEKRPAMLANLRNLFHRAPLTGADIRTLRGVIRALAEGPKRGRPAKVGEARDMAELRRLIDAVDARLVALLAERQDCIDRAAELKAGAGLPARIPARVEEVIANVRAGAAQAGLDPALAEALWRLLIEHAIAHEAERLGPG